MQRLHINDDPGLEREADDLGARAARGERVAPDGDLHDLAPTSSIQASPAPGDDRPDEDDDAAVVTLDQAAADDDAPSTGRSAAVQAHRSSPPIQRASKKGTKKRKPLQVRFQIRVDRPMTGDEFKVEAMRQVIGDTLVGGAWENIKDSYTPDDSPVSLKVDVAIVKQARGAVNEARGIEVGADGTIAGSRDRAEAFDDMPGSGPKSALMAEIDRRYYEVTGAAPGTLVKRGDVARAEVWRAVRDEVLFQNAYLANLPPTVKELIRFNIRGRDLSPADYDRLFGLAKRIEQLPPGQAADYASKITAGTTELDVFEASLDRYGAEMGERASQGEEREQIKTKLLGLEAVYRLYRDYKMTKGLEAAYANNTVDDGAEPDTTLSDRQAVELRQQLAQHGFAGLDEFQTFIARFESAFELEAQNIAKDYLTRYESRLYKESERYQDPAQVAALHAKLGGARAHQAEASKQQSIHDDYQAKNTAWPHGIVSNPDGPTRDEAQTAKRRASTARDSARADLTALAAEHPIFQDEGLPSDKRIDVARLTTSSESELGSFLQAHIASRIGDVGDARAQVTGERELIYKMGPLLPHFYAQQGIAPGSIYDLIIQDKMRQDLSDKIMIGIAVAVLSIALAVVSLGTATPAILAVGAAVAGAGLSGYMVYEEYQQYNEANDLSDVGLAPDPSVVWLVISIAGAGLDMAAAVKAVRALTIAAKALDGGGELADFAKAVNALKEAGEIDARIAESAVKAAAARRSAATAFDEMVGAFAGKLYSFPGQFFDPQFLAALGRFALATIKRGVHSSQVFMDEIRRARAMAGLGDLAPEELVKAKEVWTESLQLASANPALSAGEIVAKQHLTFLDDAALQALEASGQLARLGEAPALLERLRVNPQGTWDLLHRLFAGSVDDLERYLAQLAKLSPAHADRAVAILLRPANTLAPDLVAEALVRLGSLDGAHLTGLDRLARASRIPGTLEGFVRSDTPMRIQALLDFGAAQAGQSDDYLNAMLRLYEHGVADPTAARLAALAMGHPDIPNLERWLKLASRQRHDIEQLKDLELSLIDGIGQRAIDPATELEVFIKGGAEVPPRTPGAKNFDVVTATERREWKRVRGPISTRQDVHGQINEARGKFHEAGIPRGAGGKSNVALVDFGNNLAAGGMPEAKALGYVQDYVTKDAWIKAHVDELVIIINGTEHRFVP